MDKLEAVNDVLGSIGELPVDTLGAGLPLVGIAERTLDHASRRWQAKGWWFNTVQEKEMNPDQSGVISVPANAISIEPIHYDRGRRLVAQDDTLYDLDRDSSVFEEKVTVKVIRFIPWDALPEVFQNFAAFQAGRRVAARQLGSQDRVRFAQVDEEQAWQELMAEDIKMANENALASPGTREIVSRAFNPSNY